MGTIRRLRTSLLASIVALGLACGLAPADTVTLRDGRVFEGRVLQHRGLEVEIDCVINGIRSRLTFRQVDVRSVEFAELPEDFFEPPAPEPKPPPKPASPPPPKMRYTVLPLHGTFGEELHADDVRKVLGRARSTSDCIVVDVDSAGGFVAEAQAITEVLEEFAEHFTYVAVVHKGLSAGIFPIFACDHVLMQPGGTIGAAVPFLGDPATGSADVDAKFNSALAARIAALAERHGWSPAIARAMVVRGETLVRWTEHGETRLAPVAPDGTFGVEVIDDAGSVLTISADLASRLGFPRVLTAPTAAEEVGPAFAPAVIWKRGSRYGHVVHEEAVEAWKTFRDGYTSQVAIMASAKANMDEARTADPDRQRYTWKHVTVYDQGRLRYVSQRVPTDESWDKWYGSTDHAIAAWKRAATLLEQAGRLNDAAPYYYRTREYDGIELRDEYERALREIRRLEASRGRGPTY